MLNFLPILKVREGCWRISSFHLRELSKGELRVLINSDDERKFPREIHNKKEGCHQYMNATNIPLR